MNKYSGIDLHSNNCVVAVIDEADRVCCERRVPNDLSQILALLEPYREELVSVVVESTSGWSMGCSRQDTESIWPTR